MESPRNRKPSSSCDTLDYHGSCAPNPGTMGIHFAIRNSDNKVLCQFRGCVGEGTNNRAEYMALIAGLKKAADLGLTHLIARGHNLTIVNAVSGKGKPIYKRDRDIQPLLQEVLELTRSFDTFSIEHLPKTANERAGQLARHQQLLEGRSEQRSAPSGAGGWRSSSYAHPARNLTEDAPVERVRLRREVLADIPVERVRVLPEAPSEAPARVRILPGR